MSFDDYHNLAYWYDDELAGEADKAEGKAEKRREIMNAQELDEFVEKMFTALENPNEPLTDWEDGFISSIKEQWEKKRYLSAKQRTILERIYTEKTS